MSNKNPELISFKRLRIAIGLLGIALPFILIIGNAMQDCNTILDSLSHYYYSKTGDFFIGIISTYAVLLFCYRGYDRTDNIITNLGGICAILFILYPTTQITGAGKTCDCQVFSLSGNRDILEIVHFSSAVCFLLSMAFMSFFQFSRLRKNISKLNKVKYWIFKICGILILIAIIAAGIVFCLEKHFDYYKGCIIHPVVICESIAVIAFGISWLTKSKFFEKNK